MSLAALQCALHAAAHDAPLSARLWRDSLASWRAYDSSSAARSRMNASSASTTAAPSACVARSFSYTVLASVSASTSGGGDPSGGAAANSGPSDAAGCSGAADGGAAAGPGAWLMAGGAVGDGSGGGGHRAASSTQRLTCGRDKLRGAWSRTRQATVAQVAITGRKCSSQCAS